MLLLASRGLAPYQRRGRGGKAQSEGIGLPPVVFQLRLGGKLLQAVVLLYGNMTSLLP